MCNFVDCYLYFNFSNLRHFMDFYDKLLEICERCNCSLQLVGDEAPAEYVGWENSILLFSQDAKQGEYDLIILKDSDNPIDIINEFSAEEGLSQSHKQVLKEISEWVFNEN